MGTRCANHVTPLYPQKLALTLPTGGGRSVGMVRSRTKATEFSFSGKIIKEMSVSVASGTHCTILSKWLSVYEFSVRTLCSSTKS